MSENGYWKQTKCATCDIAFALPSSLWEQRKKDGAVFFCPNGHSLSFRNNQVHQLEEKCRLLRSRLEMAREEVSHYREENRHLGARIAGYKGALARMRKK